MTQMIKPLISMLKERSDAVVWQVIRIIITVRACVVKVVGVGSLSVGIAVLTRDATSMISVVKQVFSVPIVSRHFFTPSIVMDLAVIPNAWAEIFGGNKMT